MLIFKGIHVYNQYGILFTAMYTRNVEKGEIEVTALGVTDDSLDTAILDAIRSKYNNIRFYESKEINEDQLEDFKSNYKGDTTANFKLLIVDSKVNTVDLTVRINDKNPVKEEDKVKSISIEYKAKKGITDRQMETITVL